MALLLVGLLTAGACAGLYFVLQPKWQVHESRGGGFKVELPAEPRNDMEDMVRAQAVIQQNVRIEGTVLIVKLEEYSVVYADIDADLRRSQSDDDILDDTVDALKEDDPGVQVHSDKPTTVSGFPAREVVFTHADDGGTFVCRIVVADTRLYIVTAGGPFLEPNGNERTRRFLDSFQITDARLVEEQKQQAAIRNLAKQGVQRARERGRERKGADE
jgi:hypothetical protein